jgi:hypothetical protein
VCNPNLFSVSCLPLPPGLSVGFPYRFIRQPESLFQSFFSEGFFQLLSLLSDRSLIAAFLRVSCIFFLQVLVSGNNFLLPLSSSDNLLDFPCYSKHLQGFGLIMLFTGFMISMNSDAFLCHP